MRNVALIGRARSGKDSVGARLESRYGYTRLAFADPLKKMALEVNPWIVYGIGGMQSIRLADLIEHVGWERAKDEYPEVRRILQATGQSVRDRDPIHWLRLMMASLDAARLAGANVVVTDVRYPNEANTLRLLGFRMVRIIRPSLDDHSPTHASETALDGFSAGLTIYNDGTLADLAAQADSIAH